jgi:hypothetical protein
MKRPFIFLALCSALIGPIAAFAGQTCNVFLGCTFQGTGITSFGGHLWGTIVGNPSENLTVTWETLGDPTPTIEKSTSCTSSPSGFFYAEVDLIPNVTSGQDFIRFVKTTQGLIGTANLSSQALGFQTGELPIVCTQIPD